MMFQKEIQKYLTDHGFGSFVPKVVLFDMDGVLYDSMPNHAKAWQEAMAEFGIHFTAEDSYATEGMRGVDTIRIYARKQLGKELSEAEAQQMYDEKAPHATYQGRWIEDWDRYRERTEASHREAKP